MVKTNKVGLQLWLHAWLPPTRYRQAVLISPSGNR